MILAIVRIVAPPTRRNDVVQILRSLVGPTQVEPGCLSCGLYQGLEDANTLTFMEEWHTQEDFERHLRSEAYRKLLEVMELASEAPTVQFHTVVHTAGIEAIYAARGLP
jgi:quinol monooxygenase YgiN